MGSHFILSVMRGSGVVDCVDECVSMSISTNVILNSFFFPPKQWLLL